MTNDTTNTKTVLFCGSFSSMSRFLRITGRSRFTLRERLEHLTGTILENDFKYKNSRINVEGTF